MSEENFEIVQRAYAPDEGGVCDTDLLDALAPQAAPEIEFDFTDTYPDGPVVKGLARTRTLMANWPWGRLHFEPEGFIEVDGDRVLVFVRAAAQGVGSGVPVERRTAHECTFEDGRLVRFKVYSDRDHALAANGVDAGDEPARRSSLTR
jgi:ketosteroid isomerase-like protein